MIDMPSGRVGINGGVGMAEAGGTFEMSVVEMLRFGGGGGGGGGW